MVAWLQEMSGASVPDWLTHTNANLLGAVMMIICVGMVAGGLNISRHFVNVMSMIQIAIVLFIILVGFSAMNGANSHPFVPKEIETRQFGMSGIMAGAVRAFFGF